MLMCKTNEQCASKTAIHSVTARLARTLCYTIGVFGCCFLFESSICVCEPVDKNNMVMRIDEIHSYLSSSSAGRRLLMDEASPIK